MTAYGQGRGRHVERAWRAGEREAYVAKWKARYTGPRTIEQRHADLIAETRFIERTIVVISLCIWAYVGWLVIEKVIGW
jgi:hypothetical protein